MASVGEDRPTLDRDRPGIPIQITMDALGRRWRICPSCHGGASARARSHMFAPARARAARAGWVSTLPRANDWIAPVEAAYALERTEGQWLRGVLNACAVLLEDGLGVMALEVRSERPNAGRPRRLVVGPIAARGASHRLRRLRATLPRTLPPAVLAGRGEPIRSFRDLGGAEWALFRDAIGRCGATDCLLMVARRSGAAVLVVAPRRSRVLRVPSRAAWSSVAAHIAAGQRARDALEAARRADGAFEGAPELTPPQVMLRTRVPTAVPAIATGRRAPRSAPELWRGLVQGRFGLVDVFDARGRRYVVAVRSPPGARDARGLSAREVEVAALLRGGMRNKHIAYELDVSVPRVANCVRALKRKLRARSRSELVLLLRALSPSRP